MLFSKMSPFPEFCFGKWQHEVRIKMLINQGAANLQLYDLEQNWDLWCHVFMEKMRYMGKFFFYLPDDPEEKDGPIKKINRKRSIEILQSANRKSREILAHSFTLKILDL